MSGSCGEKVLLGYDIGGTKIGIGLVTESGRLLGKRRVENKDTDPEEILPLLAETGKALAEESSLAVSDLAGFGISAPGPADIPNGILLDPPNNRKWRNVPILDYLRNALKIPGCLKTTPIPRRWRSGSSAQGGGRRISFISP